jgi:threonine dehydrogenase-like Zn-dependent dehydrogenase
MMGAQRGLDVHVLDHHDNPDKRVIVRELGGTYHLGGIAGLDGLKPDILMECTGAPSVIRDVLGRTAPGGIVCLVGVSAPGHDLNVDIGEVNRTMVLDNDTVFGTVNANRAHYEDAVTALQRAEKDWLSRLITRRVAVEQWTQALERVPGDIKVIVDFT